MNLRVSMLEALRYYKNAENADLDSLLLSLADQAVSNRKMQAGHALAKFFEHVKPDATFDEVESEGWKIYFNIEGDFPCPGLRECAFQQDFWTPSGPITLTGHVDSISGLTVRDQKLTEVFDVEAKYIDSLQWRAYLVMSGACTFVYDVFVGKVSDHDDSVAIREYHPVTFYRYPGIERDVQRSVDELAEVATKYSGQIEAIRKGASSAT